LERWHPARFWRAFSWFPGARQRTGIKGCLSFGPIPLFSAAFPQRSFVFIDIPGSFVHFLKCRFPETGSTALRVARCMGVAFRPCTLRTQEFSPAALCFHRHSGFVVPFCSCPGPALYPQKTSRISHHRKEGRGFSTAVRRPSDYFPPSPPAPLAVASGAGGEAKTRLNAQISAGLKPRPSGLPGQPPRVGEKSELAHAPNHVGRVREPPPCKSRIIAFAREMLACLPHRCPTTPS
jgi:hypothetical protein